MRDLPRISIAVPSFNQGRFIRETLQSLVDQEYPNLEAIIQDGGSTDGAAEIAAEFVNRNPGVFQLQVQKDRGHAHAVNMALARSTGEILGYLNTDDTLLPGCLHRVAREIDPARGRYIVFGRSVFVGEEGTRYAGVEHPAEYKGRFAYLAVWRHGYNTIPQPSTFWHRAVQEKCGGFDERFNQGLDYLQWCRVSRYYWFHKVDELWSTYRLHPASVSGQMTEGEWLEIMIRYSRMNWGPWWHPLRWRCQVSHWFHDQQHHERARHHARRAEEARSSGRLGVAFAEAAKTLAHSPRMAYHRFMVPAMQRVGLAAAERLLFAPAEPGFTGRYADGWVGPLYRDEFDVPGDASRLVLNVTPCPPATPAPESTRIVVLMNGRRAAIRKLSGQARVEIRVSLQHLRGRHCRLEIRTDRYFIPQMVRGTADRRKLSLRLHEQRVT